VGLEPPPSSGTKGFHESELAVEQTEIVPLQIDV
jgi:hypothetical protein